MIKDVRYNLNCKIAATAVMTLENPDIDIDEAVERLKAAGNEIISVDGRKVTVLNTETHPSEEVWACEHCGAYSTDYDTVLRHEAEQHGIQNS
ncbi:hypothetical protein [Zhongshania sp.]|uniref:hypothetical protein n=1 Tax=Zhongshania sp. TaxID=1971902 RepID=UPI003565C590